ncbi:type III-B CRISPR module-associated Cmr3 family protein [Saccharolobus sp. E5-1-F]|uniref:type III-B CRISPR module-associated Cmr3 family protein n=1 Tax=Saccharolobus sp. E5-1-F TaxID=2663019 RepID=UPI0013869899|nr:type III-B CRISPR module-associated Cmr3 family protein [Sulfolobus sp. E5-1-F]
MQLICFKPLEPTLFRLHGEFDINLKGPYSRAESLNIPLPSTIAGIISTINIENKTVNLDESKKETDQSYTLNGNLWGPIVLYSNITYVYNYLKNKFFLLSNGTIDKTKSIETKATTRIGIALDEKQRVTKEGYIYSVTFRDFENMEFCYRYEGKTEIIGEKVVKFGGEERAAKMYKKEVQINCEKSRKAYVISPLLIEGEEKDNFEITVNNTNIKIEQGVIYSVGLGFNVRLKKRKPIYRAIMPGSIIELDREAQCESIGLYSQIGYGSIVPLKSIEPKQESNELQ